MKITKRLFYISTYEILIPTNLHGTNSMEWTFGSIHDKSRNELFTKSNLNVNFEYCSNTESNICIKMSSPRIA